MSLIQDVVPNKATYHPGESATITVTLANPTPDLIQGNLQLTVMHLADTIEALTQPIQIAPNATLTTTFTFTPPPTPMQGYGLDVALLTPKGETLAQASGALDVLERWSQAPRYGFLSDFAPDQEKTVEARADSLSRYHLNVVQFYDWMWRHYRLLPPTDEFDDALGRRLSLRTVRSAIANVQSRGGAALAYGAVYGAEPEYADLHPDLRLYDQSGKPISLAELFYIMNIAPGSEWTDLMVAEFAETVTKLDFDGIHLDQYGFPKTDAYDASGATVDLADYFPPMINQSKAAVAAAREGAGVIFNAVENWPIETVAPTNQDAVYIEVWPPYISYNDLRKLIQEGKRLGIDKQVILAAYLSPYAEATDENSPQIESAALLATAAITSSGGFHLLLGEQNGVLCDPYYPKYATMRPHFVLTMRAYYDFLVRYEELFTAPDVEDWITNYITITGVESSQQAEPGKIWAIPRSKPNYRILNLINLANQQDTAWNAPRTVPQPIANTEIHMANHPPVKQILFLTPETQRPTQLEWAQQPNDITVNLPAYLVWAVLVVELQ